MYLLCINLFHTFQQQFRSHFIKFVFLSSIKLNQHCLKVSLQTMLDFMIFVDFENSFSVAWNKIEIRVASFFIQLENIIRVAIKIVSIVR